MKLNAITLRNAFSHKETEIELDGHGLCLIKGKNGAGKSSIVKALLFAFFGIGTDDVVNNKVGKNTSVKVYGENGEDTFTVRRYRQHTEHKNNLYFSINNEEVAGATNTALQAKLESYLGCDYRSFLTITSFSSDMMMFASATDAERKGIFEKILQDLDVYREYEKEVRQELLETEVDMGDLGHDIVADERELEVIKKVMETEEKRALVLEQRRKERIEELEDRRHELEKRVVTSERLKGKRERYNNAVFRLERWLDKNLDPAEEIQDIDNEVYMLDMKEGDLAFDDCPVCSTKLTPVHRKEEMNKIKKRKKELDKEVKVLEDFRNIRMRVTDVMNTLFENIAAIDYKLVRFESTAAKVEELDGKIEEAKSRLEDPNEAVEMWTKKLRKLSKSIASATKRVKTFEEKLQYLKEVAQGFSKQGIPNIIITRALTMLERCANGYMDTLTSGAMSLRLTGMTKTKKGAVRNKIGIEVVSESGVTRFDSYSGGERQRLNIALLLALRDVAEHNKGIKLNCLFLDEVLDLSLDEEGIEEVLQVLRVKKSAVDSIFVITPKQQLLHNTGVTFDTVMTVEKKAGYSTVELKESL
jgi:DNA repair exonuclease SbcCD ATPase subunit